MAQLRGVPLLRRYAPFLAIAAVQLVLVAVVPSVSGSNNSLGSDAPLPLLSPTSGPSTTGGSTGGAGSTGTAGSTSGSTTGTSGSTTGAGGSTAGTGTGGTGGTTSGTSGGPSGPDYSKCAKGHVLQQTVTQESVPCLPKFVGDNGGATYRGVTRTSITIVIYQAKVNPVVNSVIAAAGAGEDPVKQRDAIAVYASFFQKHYELAGRTIIWKTFQGSCKVDPPDNVCLQGEARTIVSTLHPFWVIWPEGRPSFYQELSKLGVLNSGGLSFAGSFNRAQRPYHYMAFMDGDRIATSLADYWCKNLNGKKATLAGDATLKTQTRKLGILVRQEPANAAAATELQSLVSGGMCAGPKPIIVTYSQDISTAETQSSEGVAKLRQAGVTTVVSLGSILEITLQCEGFDNNSYHPENLMSGTGLEDVDAAGRLVPSDQWSHAFGLGDQINAQPAADADAAKAWQDAGRTGVPYTQAGITFQEMQQVVWQLQLTGADLAPLKVEQASLSLPPLGAWATDGHNPYSVRYQFSSQGYSGPSDTRIVYWDANAISKSDGKAGAYVALNGGERYPVGQLPVIAPRTAS